MLVSILAIFSLMTDMGSIQPKSDSIRYLKAYEYILSNPNSLKKLDKEFGFAKTTEKAFKFRYCIHPKRLSMVVVDFSDSLDKVFSE